MSLRKDANINAITQLDWGDTFLPLSNQGIDYFVRGIGYSPDENTFSLTQTHSNVCLAIDNLDHDAVRSSEADAMISAIDQNMAIKTADCLPVLMASKGAGVVACIHAGWRGLVGGVIENTIAEFKSRRIPEDELIAFLGPCIGYEKFEVGQEVVNAFDSYMSNYSKYFDWVKPNDNDKHKISLQNVCLNMLLSVGLKPENIGVMRVCTFDRADILHSYRRDGKNAGRNWTGIRANMTKF